jgi:hypothetical protein
MIISFAEDVIFVFVSMRAMRIENAKQFLKENLIEIIVCAARIYDLIEITLYSSLSREKNEAEKNEKARIKQIKKMKKQNVFISIKLMISIANPEAK